MTTRWIKPWLYSPLSLLSTSFPYMSLALSSGVCSIKSLRTIVPDRKGGSPVKLLRSLDSVPPTNSGFFFEAKTKKTYLIYFFLAVVFVKITVKIAHSNIYLIILNKLIYISKFFSANKVIPFSSLCLVNNIMLKFWNRCNGWIQCVAVLKLISNVITQNNIS